MAEKKPALPGERGKLLESRYKAEAESFISRVEIGKEAVKARAEEKFKILWIVGIGLIVILSVIGIIDCAMEGFFILLVGLFVVGGLASLALTGLSHIIGALAEKRSESMYDELNEVLLANKSSIRNEARRRAEEALKRSDEEKQAYLEMYAGSDDVPKIAGIVYGKMKYTTAWEGQTFTVSKDRIHTPHSDILFSSGGYADLPSLEACEALAHTIGQLVLTQIRMDDSENKYEMTIQDRTVTIKRYKLESTEKKLRSLA